MRHEVYSLDVIEHSLENLVEKLRATESRILDPSWQARPHFVMQVHQVLLCIYQSDITNQQGPSERKLHIQDFSFTNNPVVSDYVPGTG